MWRRLIGGHEDSLGLSSRSARDPQQACLLGSQVDLVGFRHALQRALPIRYSVSCTTALWFAKTSASLTQPARLESKSIVAVYNALGRQRGAEKAIACLLQRGQFVLDVAFKAGVGRLHHHRFSKRRDMKLPASRARLSSSAPRPSRHKRGRVRLAIDRERFHIALSMQPTPAETCGLRPAESSPAPSRSPPSRCVRFARD